jgi:hypothetical protein
MCARQYGDACSSVDRCDTGKGLYCDIQLDAQHGVCRGKLILCVCFIDRCDTGRWLYCDIQPDFQRGVCRGTLILCVYYIDSYDTGKGLYCDIHPDVQRRVCRGTLILCVCVMVFNATFNNMSVISWRSVLLVEETGVRGENYRPVASHTVR